MRKKVENNNLNLGSLHEVQKRRSLGELVFENLKQAIVQGDLGPGTWLVESQIADAQGISRTPVREAIHKLERERFVERQPRGGFVVLGLNREDIEETFGIRSVLEGYAARLAAIKHDPEELKPLDRKIEEFQKYLDNNQLAPLLKINTEFHDLLYNLSQSPKLIHIINGLRDHIFRFRQIILKESKRAKMSNDDHRKMLKLIRQRDADGVELVVKEHILRGQMIVLNELDRQGFD